MASQQPHCRSEMILRVTTLRTRHRGLRAHQAPPRLRDELWDRDQIVRCDVASQITSPAQRYRHGLPPVSRRKRLGVSWGDVSRRRGKCPKETAGAERLVGRGKEMRPQTCQGVQYALSDDPARGNGNFETEHRSGQSR